MNTNGGNRRNSSRRGGLVTKAAFRALEARLNPNIKGTPAVAQPRPVTGSGDFWTQRRVQLTLTVSPGAVASLTSGDLVKQLTSAPITLNVRIRRITVFGFTGGALTATINIQNFCDSIAGTNPVTSSDRGTSTRLPGLKFEIPRLVADSKSFSSTSTTVLAVSTSTGLTTAANDIIYDVDLEYQLP